MWIGHRKEIGKLTFRALALRRSEFNVKCNKVSVNSVSATQDEQCLHRKEKTMQLFFHGQHG